MAEKTALVVHGGALKTAYGGGFLFTLGHAGLTSFDYVVGTSAGTANATYFVSRQYDDIKSISLDYIAKRKDFVSYWRMLQGKPLIEVPYLINVMKQEKILDRDALVRAPSQLILPLYNYTAGRREYFSNRDSDANEAIFETLQICMTIHTDHTVRRGEHSYADSEVEPYALYCDPILTEVDRALVIKHDRSQDFDFMQQAGTWIYRTLLGNGIPPEGHALLARRTEIYRENKKCFTGFCDSRNVHLHTPIDEAAIGPLTLADGSEANIVRLFSAGILAAERFLTSRETRPFAESLRARSDELERART